MQVRRGAGEGRVVYCTGLCGLRGRASGCPRESWPLPQAGSPGCGGLCKPPAHLCNVGSKNSWILYPSCVLAVPSRCQGEGFGSSGSAKFQLLQRVFVGMQGPLPMGKMLPQPLPHTAWQRLSLTSYLAEQRLYPSPKKMLSEVKYSGHAEVGKHHRHVASARGASTVF